MYTLMYFFIHKNILILKNKLILITLYKLYKCNTNIIKVKWKTYLEIILSILKIWLIDKYKDYKLMFSMQFYLLSYNYSHISKTHFTYKSLPFCKFKENIVSFFLKKLLKINFKNIHKYFKLKLDYVIYAKMQS